jgi:hypothetical protein
LKKLLLVVMLVLPTIAKAQTPFEAAVAGTEFLCAVGTPFVTQAAQWFNPDFRANGPFAIASGDGLRVVGLSRQGGGFRVERYPAPWAPATIFTNTTHFPVDMTQAPGGRIFVTAIDGPDAALFVLSSAGALEATHPLAEAPRIAAGPDGCTLYTWDDFAGGTIGRVNGCTGAALAPFATFSETIRDVFPIGDGSALVVAGQSVHVVNEAGVPVPTLDLTDYGVTDDDESIQIALSADRVLYVAVSGCLNGARLIRIAFDTSVELSRRENFGAYQTINSLVVGPASVAGVPALDTMGLLLATIALAAAGWFVLRLRA